MKLAEIDKKINHVMKYLALALILVLYGMFVMYRYGASEGALITVLTWSFFVLCTPIADAGFLLDFPVRLLVGLKMIYTEIIVWFVAITVNFYALFLYPDVYSSTGLLKLFHHILTQPVPYWLIIILSSIGTFLSIYFGDEIIDISGRKQKHHRYAAKYRIIIMVVVILLVLALYDFMLVKMGVSVF